MCGIAGVYNLNNESVSSESLKRMINIIKHRGPDDEGYYFNENIGMGHARLSIIDLSDAAHQPMSNEDGAIWITYNGEIYNHRELAAELKSLGHCFRSASDTEAIIHAYEEWGIDCVKRFNGMWAFAIWDSREKKFFLSRDRLGVKPLYYYWNGGQLVFASEIKALLMLPNISRLPNLGVIDYFLKTGILDYDEETFFTEIKSVLPAHSIVISKDQKDIKKIRYWELNFPRIAKKKDFQSAAAEFRELLSDAVRLRLRADVEVGSCLSGGIDSSSIVSLATKLHNGRLKTFSSVYDEKEYSEKKYVDIAAADCHTDKYLVNPKPSDLIDDLSDIVWFNDGPTTDPTIFSQWSVMKLAHKKIKVLLDGQGGDELLGGYHKYFPDYLNTLFKLGVKKNPGYIRDYMELFSSVYPGQSVLKNMLRCLLSLGMAKDDTDNDFNLALMNDLISTRLPWLLHYEDRCSMAFSIESRTPFLDYRLVEFAMSLPFNYKIDRLQTKVILRKALEGIVSQEILDRQDKKGYPTPAAIWFRKQLRPFLESVINSESFASRRIFRNNKAKERLREHCREQANHTDYLWRYLTTEIWFRHFI